MYGGICGERGDSPLPMLNGKCLSKEKGKNVCGSNISISIKAIGKAYVDIYLYINIFVIKYIYMKILNIYIHIYKQGTIFGI